MSDLFFLTMQICMNEKRTVTVGYLDGDSVTGVVEGFDINGILLVTKYPVSNDQWTNFIPFHAIANINTERCPIPSTEDES